MDSVWSGVFWGTSLLEVEPDAPPGVAHLLCTSKTRIARLGGLRAAALAQLDGARRWTLHLTEVCDEEGPIAYGDATRLADENAAFDRYRLVRPGALPPLAALALLAGAARGADGAPLGPNDVLVVLDPASGALAALAEAVRAPGAPACAFVAAPAAL